MYQSDVVIGQIIIRRVEDTDTGLLICNAYYSSLYSCMGSLREPLLQAQLDQAIDIHKQSPLWHFATDILVSNPGLLGRVMAF